RYSCGGTNGNCQVTRALRALKKRQVNLSRSRTTQGAISRVLDNPHNLERSGVEPGQQDAAAERAAVREERTHKGLIHNDHLATRSSVLRPKAAAEQQGRA